MVVVIVFVRGQFSRAILENGYFSHESPIGSAFYILIEQAAGSLIQKLYELGGKGSD